MPTAILGRWATVKRTGELACGTKLPTVGRVCMDMVTVDATGLDVHPGDRITLCGCTSALASTTWRRTSLHHSLRTVAPLGAIGAARGAAHESGKKGAPKDVLVVDSAQTVRPTHLYVVRSIHQYITGTMMSVKNVANVKPKMMAQLIGFQNTLLSPPT